MVGAVFSRPHQPGSPVRRSGTRVATAVLFCVVLITIGCSSGNSTTGNSTTDGAADSAIDSVSLEPTDLESIITETRSTSSGTATAVLTTSNPERFLKGETELRYDGDNRQSSVRVSTNDTGLGAVVVDSSIVDGVGAQRWPLTEVWVEADPQLPNGPIDAQLELVATLAADFVACASNVDGIDGFCATADDGTDLDLLHSMLETFNVARRYVSSGPVEVTVWVDRQSGLLDAVFVDATDSADGTSPGDEITYELRYSSLGEPAVFSEIEIVCGALATEADYATCLADLGVTNAPPWTPAGS